MDQRKNAEHFEFGSKEELYHGKKDEEFGMTKYYCAGCRDWVFATEKEWRKHLKVTGHRAPTVRPKESITWEKAQKPHHGAIRPTENPDISEHYCDFCGEYISDIVWRDHLNKTGHRTVWPDSGK